MTVSVTAERAAAVEPGRQSVFAALFRGDLSWQDRALCSETDPEEFFPDKGGSTARAKLVCRACPVRAECLEYALEMERGSLYLAYGIWGGLSVSERQAVARDRERRAERVRAKALDNGPDKRAPEIESPQAGGTGRSDNPADNEPEPEPAPAPEPEAPPVPEPAPTPVLEPAQVAQAAPAAPARRHRKCGYPLGSIGHQVACGGPS